jgi:DNA-binding NarL/FixJ family response regulator
LVLVAQGKANKEIAGELVISERTVRTHVSNILAKLDLSSRTQAALWAVREGLAAPPG